jgi:hypothetical protein
VIAVSYAVACLASIAVFLVMWRSTRSRKEVDPARLAKREKGWLAAMPRFCTPSSWNLPKSAFLAERLAIQVGMKSST